jgi:hypothetical protein
VTEIKAQQAAWGRPVHAETLGVTALEVYRGLKALEVLLALKAIQAKTVHCKSTCRLKILPLQDRMSKPALFGLSLKRGTAYAYVGSQCEKHRMGYGRIEDRVHSRSR